MCQNLEWELNVDPVTLNVFEEIVWKDFAGQVPYSTINEEVNSTTICCPLPTPEPLPNLLSTKEVDPTAGCPNLLNQFYIDLCKQVPPVNHTKGWI
ncbi:hypothetical protein V8B97DRAFT_1993464, partial [Scleroderma yunnanense]